MQSDASYAETLHQLHLSCREALHLSEMVSVRLQQGASARDLVPLLHQEARLAGQMHEAIHWLAQIPLPSDQRAQHARLVDQFARLLDRERANHRMLNRRGVRISGGSPYRYRPAKGGRR